MITKRLVLAPVVVLLLLGTALTACGKGDVKPASSGEESATETTEAADTTTTEATAPAVEATFVATDYAYTAAGDGGSAPLPAGPVTITLRNDGAEEHQLSIVRLREGKTEDDFAALGDDLSKFAEVVETFGGPNSVAPGGEGTTTQVLEAGDYLFACFIPAADGVAHVAKGMLLPVTVEGDAPAAAVAGDATIELAEYTFGLGTLEEPADLAAGEVDFTNAGEQPHEAGIYAPADGFTMQDLVDFFSSPAPEGPPPYVSVGGIGPVDPGRIVRATLAPGDYVFVCFIPDAADGAPHFVKGMMEFATVS